MKLLIYGTGSFSQLAHYHFSTESSYEVVAFIETAPEDETQCCELPIISEQSVLDDYDPSDYHLFVAIGYRAMNQFRMDVCQRMSSQGYTLASFISPRAITHTNVKIGKNVFVFELNNIQPFSTIEDGVVLWSGNHIGHHSTVEQYCFISSHVVVSGHCRIGQRSFLGVNSTITDSVHLGARNLVGAGATIAKSTDNDAVWTAKHTTKAAGNSLRYL